MTSFTHMVHRMPVNFPEMGVSWRSKRNVLDEWFFVREEAGSLQSEMFLQLALFIGPTVCLLRSLMRHFSCNHFQWDTTLGVYSTCTARSGVCYGPTDLGNLLKHTVASLNTKTIIKSRQRDPQLGRHACPCPPLSLLSMLSVRASPSAQRLCERGSAISKRLSLHLQVIRRLIGRWHALSRSLTWQELCGHRRLKRGFETLLWRWMREQSVVTTLDNFCHEPAFLSNVPSGIKYFEEVGLLPCTHRKLGTMGSDIFILPWWQKFRIQIWSILDDWRALWISSIPSSAVGLNFNRVAGWI